MELSRNARAFSIESLTCTDSIEVDHDENRNAEIYSRSEQQRMTEEGSERKAEDEAQDPLVCRATSLLRDISVHDKIGLTLPRKLFPETHNFSAEEDVPNCNKIFNTSIFDLKMLPKGGATSREDGLLSTNMSCKSHDYSASSPVLNMHGEIRHGGPAKEAGATGEKETLHGSGFVDMEHPILKIVDGIHVDLENSALWRMFNKCGTEMIVNRIGRRMFPCIVTTIRGMDPSAMYRVQMELDSSDRNRYKFINGKWMPVGKADPEPPNEPFEHPDSPSLGAFWMQDKVSFSKLKITNNKETRRMNIVLHSMHKYTPRIILTKLSGSSPVSNTSTQRRLCDQNVSTEGESPYHLQPSQRPPVQHQQRVCFEFEETSFIAVTAYHSEQITQLKIQNNPFAKAFRDADITAILQSASKLSEQKDLSYHSMHDIDGLSLLHPAGQSFSINCQNPSPWRQNQGKQDRDECDLRLCTETPRLYRRAGSLKLPEFPCAPWSYDNVSMTFGTPGGSSFPSCPPQERHRNSVGVVEHAPKVDRVTSRSLSHPEIRFEKAYGPPASAYAAFDYNEPSQSLGSNNDPMYHTLRRVASSAMHRAAAKRDSFPYISPKNVLFIPKYRSADNAVFQGARDSNAHIPRRHSIIEGSPLLRASTGNLRGRRSVEDITLCPRESVTTRLKMFDGSTRSDRLLPMGGVMGDFATSSSSPGYRASVRSLTKKQNSEHEDPIMDPEPMNLTLTNP